MTQFSCCDGFIELRGVDDDLISKLSGNLRADEEPASISLTRYQLVIVVQYLLFEKDIGLKQDTTVRITEKDLQQILEVLPTRAEAFRHSKLGSCLIHKAFESAKNISQLAYLHLIVPIAQKKAVLEQAERIFLSLYANSSPEEWSIPQHVSDMNNDET
jgi:hypothetical protein